MHKLLKSFITYSSKLSFTEPNALKIPTFRVIDDEGIPVPSSSEYISQINKELLTKMYKTMIEVQEFDNLYYDLQRQGVISFYMQNSGEEGLQVAVAAGLSPED